MNQSRPGRIIQGILALTAVLFGLVTVIAGSRVLIGFHPGYIVFRPLLIYNTLMGIAYVAAGFVAWCNLERGKYAAAAICALNFLVLGTIGYLFATGSSVAVESLQAMIFRTVIWLVLFLGLVRADRRKASFGRQDT